jgi:2-methylaconitate cis-trans-isomerase PrpF
MTTIPCVLMRGGTSRGPYFLASDLPADPALRDRVLLAAMGSGHPMEIDGLGGGQPQTSKVAIVSPSARPGVDVDYLFAQVHVLERRVDTAPNCGNMLAGVGPFALESGLVAATDPQSRVVIHNVNTGKRIEALIETPGGRVTYAGDARIDGVPGTAAPIRLTFQDAAGAKTGRLLPSGRARDTIDGIDVSLLDMAMPCMLLPAAALGKTGSEPPEALDGDAPLLARLEALRLEAGRLMGLGDVRQSVIPKPVLVARPEAGGTLRVRYFMPHVCHRSLAITGSICIATACCLEGSVAADLARLPEPDRDGRLRLALEHPAGRMEVDLEREQGTGTIRRAALLRTARRIMDGRLHLPDPLPEP